MTARHLSINIEPLAETFVRTDGRSMILYKNEQLASDGRLYSTSTDHGAQTRTVEAMGLQPGCLTLITNGPQGAFEAITPNLAFIDAVAEMARFEAGDADQTGMKDNHYKNIARKAGLIADVPR